MVITISTYTIIRIYKVAAESSQQATDRLTEAIVNHAEKDFHVKDILRTPGDKPGHGRPVDLHPGRWLKSMRQRLGLAEIRMSKAVTHYFAKA
jgi:hypothetical protein